MTCENCNKPVAAQGKRFCSTTCWYAFTKKRRTVPCEVCQTLFERKSKTTRTCSVECGNQLKRSDRNVVCQTCETIFERPHGKMQLFCSRSCAQTNRVRNGEFVREEGFKYTSAAGYITVKHQGAWVQQHRLVVEEKIGRKLLPSERVHHINGIRDDNRPENLELWLVKGNSKKDPAGQRQSDLKEQFLALFDESERAIIDDKFREVYKV